MPARMLPIAIALLLIAGVTSSASAGPRFLASDSTAWVRAAIQVRQPTPPPVQQASAPARSWVESGIQVSTSAAAPQAAPTGPVTSVPVSVSSAMAAQFGPIKQLAASAMQPISRISTEAVQFRPVDATGTVLNVPEPPGILAIAIFATGLLVLSCIRRRRLSADLHPCKVLQDLDD